MLHKIAVFLTGKMFSRIKQKNASEVVYIYGMELTLSTFAEIAAILISALFFSKFGEAIVFLMVFISLRIFTGGYHALTYGKCFMLTLASFWGTALANDVLSKQLPIRRFYEILFFICIYIIIRSPVMNRNQKLNNKKKIRNIKMVSIILAVQIFSVNQFLAENPRMLSMAFLTIYLVAFLMLMADVTNVGGRKYENYC